MKNCDRCGKPCFATIMSMFNTDVICLDCKELEEQHPDYVYARFMEKRALRCGNGNFPGIGKPANL